MATNFFTHDSWKVHSIKFVCVASYISCWRTFDFVLLLWL
jgi:hypothetical protein